MRWSPVVFLLLLLTLAVDAAQQSIPPPPPQTLPWHIDAYIGFERAAELDTHGIDEQWYRQNSLQITGTQVKLHKQTVLCREGRLWSSEGDGSTEFFEGTLDGTPQEGNVALRYVGCDKCLSPKQQAVQILPIRRLNDGVVRMGSVVYDKATKPFPEQCPANL